MSKQGWKEEQYTYIPLSSLIKLIYFDAYPPAMYFPPQKRKDTSTFLN